MIRLDSSSARLLAGASALAAAAFAARRLSRRDYSFRDRTVLITGGTRGLGLAMARRFADEGARVWLIARSTEELREAADELAARGGWVRTVAADITRPHHVGRIVDTVVADGDRIDVLVNNAGIIEMSPVEHATREDFEDALATHFWGPLDLIRASLPHMRRNGEGRILNISSIGGRVALPHLAAYTASKFALVGLSESLRAELMKEGILVTTVTPGLMRTGSYVNVKLRGRHTDELKWFTAMSATPLTSMRADRAARMIVEGCRHGRATLTPGVQARVAVLLNALAPNLLAALNATVDRTLLPSPTDNIGAERGREATEVDPGFVKKILPEQTRREYHQPQPAWR
jgi:NAD(P)-dependent dehydrogenase (short-subunit alcohol dehydrogenase family)